MYIVLGVNLATGVALAGFVSQQLKETRRVVRNVDELMDCDAAFAAQAKSVIHDLEAQGFRPWIRESWRSVEAQEQAFNLGRSEVKFGFHNLTGSHGERRAFAIDVIETQESPNTSPAYAIRLAAAARKHGLSTGILWGLSHQDRAAVGTAIETQRFERFIRLGWDPCHLEPLDLSVAAASARLASEFE